MSPATALQVGCGNVALPPAGPKERGPNTHLMSVAAALQVGCGNLVLPPAGTKEQGPIWSLRNVALILRAPCDNTGLSPAVPVGCKRSVLANALQKRVPTPKGTG